MANMNLVTGYIGTNHVTSNDAGSFNAAIFGSGQYILNRGQKFAATVETNNLLRIDDGDLVMQGRHVRINKGDHVDLTIENGASDYNRNDLVVARYTKDASTGVEAVDLVVIKGTAVTGTATDPAYTAGDIINDGAVLNDMPLYRVEINGLSISKVTMVAEEAPSMPVESNPLPVKRGGTGATTAEDARKNLGAASVFVPTGVWAQYNGWSSTVPYTQTISVSGMLATDTPIVDFRGVGDDTDLVRLQSYQCVSRIVAGDGALTLYAYEEKPAEGFGLTVMVVR